MNIKKMINKRTVYTLLLVAFSTVVWGQINLFSETVPSTISEKDTNIINKRINLRNINNEIEYTDNLITRYEISEKNKNSFKALMEQTSVIDKYIAKQGKEFSKFDASNLSSYFLRNAN